MLNSDLQSRLDSFLGVDVSEHLGRAGLEQLRRTRAEEAPVDLSLVGHGGDPFIRIPDELG